VILTHRSLLGAAVRFRRRDVDEPRNAGVDGREGRADRAGGIDVVAVLRVRERGPQVVASHVHDHVCVAELRLEQVAVADVADH